MKIKKKKNTLIYTIYQRREKKIIPWFSEWVGSDANGLGFTKFILDPSALNRTNNNLTLNQKNQQSKL